MIRRASTKFPSHLVLRPRLSVSQSRFRRTLCTPLVTGEDEITRAIREHGFEETWEPPDGEHVEYRRVDEKPPLVLERAASGRSTCKGSSRKIAKGEFRLASKLAWQSGFLHIQTFGAVMGCDVLANWDPTARSGLRIAMPNVMPEYAAYIEEAKQVRLDHRVYRGPGILGKPGFGTNRRAQRSRAQSLHESYWNIQRDLTRLVEGRYRVGRSLIHRPRNGGE